MDLGMNNMLGVLQPELLIGEMPYEVSRRLERGLSVNMNWLTVARNTRDNFGEHMLSNDYIHELEGKESPANCLVRKFAMMNATVEEVQFLLWKSGLINLLDLLITNEKLKIVDPVQDTNDEVELGQSFELRVTAFGSPYPNFQWYLNNEILNGQKSSRLLVSQFSKADVGSYRCQAQQTIGGIPEEIWSPTFSLNLAKSKPSLVPGKDLQDMRLKTGDDLLLKCEVVAEPEPRYIWFKNEKELNQGSFNTYKVSNVGARDAGVYFCEAVNSLGTFRSKKITVDVSQPCFAPDVPAINVRPVVSSECSFGKTVDLLFRVHCRHEVLFSCLINDENLGNLDHQLPTGTSQTSENYFHSYNLRYEVNKSDWLRGKQGPIVIQFQAYSNGHRVSSSVRIKVKFNFTQKQFSARNKFALLIANSDYSENGLQTPVNDMRALATELISLDFRCMTCCNITKSEFMEILNCFSNFLQPGDYVVFYYAGHGFHKDGTDFMTPLHAKGLRMWNSEDIPKLDACITMTEVVNQFQVKDPALIFCVHDACRGAVFSVNSLEVPRKIAKGNTYTIYATSESYKTFEDPSSGSSLLMEHLRQLIREPVSVQELGSRFMAAFNHDDAHDSYFGHQVPMAVYDLRYDRSLTDAWTPQQNDHQTVLANWERLSNVGGTISREVRIHNIILEVKIRCEQDGYPMIISNCINIVINIAPEKSDDLTSVQGKIVCITLDSTDKEIEGKVGDTIKFPVTDLQALNDDLRLTVSFMEGKQVLEECKVNLERPSLCNIQNSLNNLNNRE